MQLINRPATSKANGTEAKEKPEEALEKVHLNENNPDEWGEFLHLPGQKFHDFAQIREEIVRDTEKMTGKNAGERALFAYSSRQLIYFKAFHPILSIFEFSPPMS